MKKQSFLIAAWIAALLALGGCDATEGMGDSGGSGCDLTAFTIGGAETGDLVEGEIDQDMLEVWVTLRPAQTDWTVRTSSSPGSVVTLREAERNGTSVYRVTAGNGADSKDYTVYKVWPGAVGITLTGGGALIGGEADTLIQVDVTPAQAWPNGVTRLSAGTPGAAANSLILEAEKGCDSYRWYVDCEPLVPWHSAEPLPSGPDGYTAGLSGGNYSIGKHVLFLVAVKNGIPYTYREVFTVSER